VLGVSLRHKIRSENVRKQLNTERMVEETQEYQKKYKNTKINTRIPKEMAQSCREDAS
jgi:GTP-sensing pleiotropic transcriptional regulator CodY